jgi:hypothetical protein
MTATERELWDAAAEHVRDVRTQIPQILVGESSVGAGARKRSRAARRRAASDREAIDPRQLTRSRCVR